MRVCAFVVEQDGVRMIRLLVEAGARLGPRPRDPRWCIAPIHEAARLKRAANCLCLAELGADPEVRMGGNLTAFEMAGPSSYASKCMREGIRRREVRGLGKSPSVYTTCHECADMCLYKCVVGTPCEPKCTYLTDHMIVITSRKFAYVPNRNACALFGFHVLPQYLSSVPH